MLDLMAVNPDGGSIPLYIYLIESTLREMRIHQQASGDSFDYEVFKTNLQAMDLTPSQLAPLKQRLSVLESFMPVKVPVYSREETSKHGRRAKEQIGLVRFVMLPGFHM